MRLDVCFSRTEHKHWWNMFTDDLEHCFILFYIGGNVYRIDDRFNGTLISEVDRKGLRGETVARISVEVESVPKPVWWVPTFTCAGFCAKFVGVSGLILTPRQLYRRLSDNG